MRFRFTAERKCRLCQIEYSVGPVHPSPQLVLVSMPSEVDRSVPSVADSAAIAAGVTGGCQLVDWTAIVAAQLS